MSTTSRAELAIAHDYLTQRGGAERVVLTLAKAFPEAPIYTTFYDPASTFAEFADYDVRASSANLIGALRRHHRAALPLLPAISSSIRIDADVVLASSSGFAHGFRTNGRKVVYCYSPARWLYQSDVYLGDESSKAVRLLLSVLKRPLIRWDKAQAASADTYLSISTVVHERVLETYGRDSLVVPAPSPVTSRIAPQYIEHPWFARFPSRFLLTVARLLPYKNVDKVLKAAVLRPDLGFVVVGRGPDRDRLVRMAPPNALVLSDLSDGQMSWLYDSCAGLVAASYEDFGLTPVEAAAHGKPSAVLRAGGFLDTMVEGETAIFFDDLDPRSVAEAVDALVATTWDQDVLRARAGVFSEAVFIERIKNSIATTVAHAS